jgi:hypothetical protein
MLPSNCFILGKTRSFHQPLSVGRLGKPTEVITQAGHVYNTPFELQATEQIYVYLFLCGYIFSRIYNGVGQNLPMEP